jgi:hypothetical protein
MKPNTPTREKQIVIAIKSSLPEQHVHCIQIVKGWSYTITKSDSKGWIELEGWVLVSGSFINKDGGLERRTISMKTQKVEEYFGKKITDNI